MQYMHKSYVKTPIKRFFISPLIYPTQMTIEEAQKKVDQWIRDIGVRYFDEMTNLAVLMEEVGELSRLFARKFGEQSFKEGEEKEEISEELADVLFVLICLANQTNTDLSKALERSLEKKTKRDINRHKNNPKLQ